jgi:hypothetical protein
MYKVSTSVFFEKDDNLKIIKVQWNGESHSSKLTRTDLEQLFGVSPEPLTIDERLNRDFAELHTTPIILDSTLKKRRKSHKKLIRKPRLKTHRQTKKVYLQY